MTVSGSRLRIVVSGLAGLHPLGGVAWDYLQYVIGLHRLGHDVHYFEDTQCWPYDPVRQMPVDTPDYSARFIGDFFRRFAPALADRWAYVHLNDRVCGMSRAAIDEVLRSADLFVNVSGANALPEELGPRCVKVFVDTDPGYNQIVMVERPAWSDKVDRWCDGIARHDHHFTYAENIGGADCTIPDTGLRWRTTRMPIVTDLWRDIADRSPAHDAPWTTVMTWNAFKGPLRLRGVEYGSKGAEFEKIVDLPRCTRVPLTLVLGGFAAPHERLAAAGWNVILGPQATSTPDAYRDFIAGSRGEVSIAKQVYVALRTGWFSCRTACYLAAGRPAVVQDTGFGTRLPVGDGLLAFDDLDGLIAAIDRVETDPVRHRCAAVEFAREHFDADRVLRRFVADCFDDDGVDDAAAAGELPC